MRSITMRCFLVAGLVLCGIVTTGCGVGGGRQQRVEFVSQPAGATVYLVEMNHWLRERERRENAGEDASDDAIMRDSAFLMPYRVAGDVTPTRVSRQARRYIAVMERNGHYERSEPFTPGQQRTVSVRIGDGEN